MIKLTKVTIAHEITMIDGSGSTEAQPGALTGGGSAFAVTWERST
jgi:hypothetical protein